MKLPAHWAGLPGEEIFIHIVPLDPVYKIGLGGTCRPGKPSIRVHSAFTSALLPLGSMGPLDPHYF